MNRIALILFAATLSILLISGCGAEEPRLTRCEEYRIDNSKISYIWYTIPEKAIQIREDSNESLTSCTQEKIVKACNTKCIEFTEDQLPGCLAVCKDDKEKECQEQVNDNKEVTAQTLADLYNQASFEACGANIVSADPVRADVKPINDVDSDGDGVNNFDEFLQNSDPCQSESMCAEISRLNPAPTCRAEVCKQ